MTPPPIILTGARRSGTTLLHQILASSSVVWSWNEMYYAHSLLFKESKQQNFTLKEKLEGHLSIELPPINDETLAAERAQWFQEVMQTTAEKADKQRWCLKDPEATYYLDDYAQAYPEAQFLIVYRDPRAVSRSCLDPRGFTVARPANWLVAAERWCRDINLQLDFASRHPERVLVLKYESIVTDLESQLLRIAEFLSIPNERSLVEYYVNKTATGIHSGNEKVLSPPDASRLNAWQKSMPNSAVQLVESVARPLMEQLGYECSLPTKKVSLPHRLLMRLHHRVVSEYRWQRYKIEQRFSS